MKQQIEELRMKAIDGLISPLVAYAELKDLKAHLDLALKDVTPIALEEADKYDKNFSYDGFKFERRNGRVTYDFKHLDAWQKANNAKKFAEEQAKQALKAMETGGCLIDDDGVVIEPPKVKYSQDTLIVKYEDT